MVQKLGYLTPRQARENAELPLALEQRLTRAELLIDIETRISQVPGISLVPAENEGTI